MHQNLLLVLTAAVALSTAAKLPKNWKTCKRTDPNINECLKVAIQGALTDLFKGVPSLGILPLDPLHMVRLELDQGSSSGPVAVNLTFLDVDFYGFKSAIINNVKFDWNKGAIQGTVDLADPISLIGGYAINGKVLVLPIVGKGDSNFTIAGASIDLVSKGSVIDKGGKKYFHVDKMDLVIRENRVYMRLDNLFNGDKVLGENMNKFLEENWKEVFESFRDTLTRGLASAFKEIANRLFDKVPLDLIAPP